VRLNQGWNHGDAVQARDRVGEVLQSNTVAPLEVASLFDEHLPILAQNPESYVANLLNRQPAMSLEDFETLLCDLDSQSEAIRLKCADTVRTGIYRHATYHE
jgi:hypothetical protein